MILVLVVDNRGGLSFNNLRQRQSYHLRKNLIELLESNPGTHSKLWVSPYTMEQFIQDKDLEYDQIYSDPNYINKAQNDDYCFVEIWDKKISLQNISKIILYHWTKKYPADSFFDPSLFCYGMVREEQLISVKSKSKDRTDLKRDIWRKTGRDGLLRPECCTMKELHNFSFPYFVDRNVPNFQPEDFKKEIYRYSVLSDEIIESMILLKGEKGKKPSSPKRKKESKTAKPGLERCHLIGIQLRPFAPYVDWKGIPKSEETVDGTHDLNCEMMFPIEDMVAGYLSEVDDDVLYRVTAKMDLEKECVEYVQMEAQSCKEDGIRFNVICKDTHEEQCSPIKSFQIKKDDTMDYSKFEWVNQKKKYVINKNSQMFHFPECHCTEKIKDYQSSDDFTFLDLLRQGYTPCYDCFFRNKPW